MTQPTIPTIAVDATWLPPTVPGGEWWMVAAYHQAGRWKVIDYQHPTEYAARVEADRLAPCWVGRVGMRRDEGRERAGVRTAVHRKEVIQDGNRIEVDPSGYSA